MTRSDYEPLIDRIKTRFQSWTTRFLSYAGRLQLIKSVIASIANFWCSVFRLPQRCLDQIESMCSAFLWSGSPTTTTKSKVRWSDLCLPKKEGGLGIRRLRDTSIAYSLSLIWRLLTSAGSYWTVWTKHYLLRHSSFWDVKRFARGSWIWNKLLKLRPLAKSFIKHSIGNGMGTYFWLDNWMGNGALIEIVGEVGPSIMGINRTARVADVVRDNEWHLRQRRNPIIQAQVLNILSLPIPTSTAPTDKLLWHHGSNNYKEFFSSKSTWEQLRRRGTRKDWAHIVWSNLSLPRYAFIAWLAMLDRLPTGARAGRWGQSQNCVFCGDPNESRDHLFFTCNYSYTIWAHLCQTFLGPNCSPNWQSTVSYLLHNSGSKENNVLARFLFQAAIYHIWRERNGIIHGKSQTPEVTIARTITSLLTLRLRGAHSTPAELDADPIWRCWISTRR